MRPIGFQAQALGKRKEEEDCGGQARGALKAKGSAPRDHLVKVLSGVACVDALFFAWQAKDSKP